MVRQQRYSFLRAVRIRMAMMIIAHAREGHPRMRRSGGSIYEQSQLQLSNFVTYFQEHGLAGNSFGLARIDT